MAVEFSRKINVIYFGLELGHCPNDGKNCGSVIFFPFGKWAKNNNVQILERPV